MNFRSLLQRAAFFALLIPFAYSHGLHAETQLLMFEQEGCHYCEKWFAEIGDRYALTDEGKAAPLRRVSIEDKLPQDIPQELSDIYVTPSFVLLHDGKVVDKLLGYAGDQFFWGQLQAMLDKLPAHVATASE